MFNINMINQPMKVIAIISGKGGVGKSTLSSSLAIYLSKKHKTLLLDFDLTAPSTSFILNASGKVIKTKNGLTPIKVTETLYCLSTALLMKEDDFIAWRAPKRLALLDLFYNSIDGFEYVIIDTPPGVKIEHHFLVDKNVKAIFITTSQNLALCDLKKSYDFCKNNNIEILGLIENQSGYNCKKCNAPMNIFSINGGKLFCEEYDIPFWGAISFSFNNIKYLDNQMLEKSKFYEELAEILNKKEF